jgi:hypothetical protein
MTNISIIYDAIDSFLIANFPDHKKMDNPYSPDLNNDKILNKGFGFYLGAANNSNRVLDCSISIERQVLIHLTRVNRGTERDVSIRQNAEKELLEDHRLLLNNILKDNSLSSTESIISRFEYQTDNGIEFVFSERGNFLLLTSIFDLEYIENIT